jgi:hypothetical protein
MPLHKFAIGQMVEFGVKSPSILRPEGPYEVVSVLPVDDANSPTYRVKSEAEPFARVAKEFDLVAVGLAASQQTSALRAGSPRPAVAIKRAKRQEPRRH